MADGDLSTDLGSEILPRSASIQPVPSQPSNQDAELGRRRRSRIEREDHEEDENNTASNEISTHQIDRLA